MNHTTYDVRVYENGDRSWRLNGKLHREDGPAVEDASGNRVWWLNGKRHREDGPAIEYADGGKEWYLNGKLLTEAEHAAATSKAQELTVAEISERLGYNVKVVK